MSDKDITPGIDLDKALLDPASMFDAPETVETHAGLSLAQRIEILRRWEYDAAEGAVATEEGMPGNDGGVLHRVLCCLDRLTGGFDTERSAPTKQRGLPRAAVGSVADRDGK